MSFAEYRYIECHYAEGHYAECHYVECHYAECHYAERHYAECGYTKCRGACKEVFALAKISLILYYDCTTTICIGTLGYLTYRV